MTEMITSNQRKKIIRFIEDGLDIFPLMKSGADRVINQGDKLQKRFRAILEELSRSDDYSDKKVAVSYVYPKRYKVKPLDRQIAILMERFGLSGSTALAYAENLPELPRDAEEWFAILRWERIAPTYGEAFEKVLSSIAHFRKFYNYHKGELGSKFLRQSVLTMKFLDRIGKEQQGDILIVAVQFGMRHRGRSVHRARAIFADNEFGLGGVGVGSMLVTHPKRLQSKKDLWIDCVGDEYAPLADGVFSDTMFFRFVDDVELKTSYVGLENDQYGSVSGFVPKSWI